MLSLIIKRIAKTTILVALSLYLILLPSSANQITWLQANQADLAKPVFYITPDQSYGVRRSVTAADRAAVARYRSGLIKPTFLTPFTSRQDLGAWIRFVDDNATLKSCRRPENVAVSQSGLVLRTLVADNCKAKWSTGQIISKEKYQYGYFEASIRAAGVSGMDNAFWLTTDDHYEIDVAEIFYPSSVSSALHYYPENKTQKHTMVATGVKLSQDLSKEFHDYGLLWTPTELIFVVDGEPTVAISTHGLKGPGNLRLSTALATFAGKIPTNPQSHNAVVRGLRVFSLNELPKKQ
ncbi:glycoside hydrolase family 16 protein [Rhizobium sp.]|uniref:glycoside hydrolase family 16 protein n=1 Tax=Rhizobium sp. TaxID=391 RepID=UPI002EE2DF10